MFKVLNIGFVNKYSFKCILQYIFIINLMIKLNQQIKTKLE